MALWLVQVLFLVVWVGYAVGAIRVRPPVARQATYHLTMAIAAATLFGPLDDWAARSTALHMAQHMLLIVVVAPLAVVARPLPQWRAAAGAGLDPLWGVAARLSRRPATCAAIHAAMLWIWHAPEPYMAAVEHTVWHLLEHACFLFSGWLFWWSILRAGRRHAFRALGALLFTLMHTGMLGALLTFAREPLYARESAALWDQQLAGLVMWVPAGGAYLAAAAWLVLRVTRETAATFSPASSLRVRGLSGAANVHQREPHLERHERPG